MGRKGAPIGENGNGAFLWTYRAGGPIAVMILLGELAREGTIAGNRKLVAAGRIELPTYGL
jgi:hypothetical protein